MKSKALVAGLVLVAALGLPIGLGHAFGWIVDDEAAVETSAALPQRRQLSDRVPATAAAALRRGDCAAALAPLALAAQRRGEGPSPPPFAHLLYGLYAHHCERLEVALRELTAAAEPGGALEDWRLLVLADVAQALGRSAVALDALDRLIDQHPTSPLAPRAHLRAAEAAWVSDGGGAGSAAWSWLERGRSGAAAGNAAEIDALAWRLAAESDNRERQVSAARRLLAAAPARAAELQVIEIFRAADGALDWSAILTPEELVARAEHLLAAGLAASAEESLQAVSPVRRDLPWTLLLARAQTAQNRGLEALDLLAAIPSVGLAGSQRTQVEWRLAEAKIDAATVRRGNGSPPLARRQQLAREAEEHWRRVVQLNTDSALTNRALRRLFFALDDDDRLDEALDVARALAQRDPADETGLTVLWQRGWQQLERGNASGAIGLWSELRSIYPQTRTARIALYWTGRAYQQLGQAERARTIFRRIAASDVRDFYAEQARSRLPASEVVAADEAPPPVAWPEDPRLHRAVSLTDAGLDDLALAEIGALAEIKGLGQIGTLAADAPGAAEPPASAALRALALARKGQRRPSVEAIAGAFPQLGWTDQSSAPLPALELYYPLDFLETVVAAARRESLDPYLVLAMIRQESAFDARAESRAGARGLLQLMPATGREVAGKLGLAFTPARLWEPEVNLRLGTRYFGQVMEMFGGDAQLALAGYNGGPYRIRRLVREAGATERDRFLEGLPVTESRRYVKRILLLADSYRRLYGDLTAPVETRGP